MGKDSKSKGSKSKTKKRTNSSASPSTTFSTGTASPSKRGPKNSNDLPRPKILLPSAYAQQAISINPLASIEALGSWINCDSFFVLPKGASTPCKPREAGFAMTCCPVCFKKAPLTCNRCQATSYCSKECQRLHWKRCHKQVCAPNPSPAPFDADLAPFHALRPEDFEPHEFLLIKPTGEMQSQSSLADICRYCLEFGNAQLDPLWTMKQSCHVVAERLCLKYGWTSGVYGVEIMEGYNVREDGMINMILCDDSFLSETSLPESYYGWAAFPTLFRDGKKPVRGNLVLFRIQSKNKKKKKIMPPALTALTIITPDADVEHEYEMYPLCKAEVAHMLKDRLNNLEKGMYSRRDWRHNILQRERQITLAE